MGQAGREFCLFQGLLRVSCFVLGGLWVPDLSMNNNPPETFSRLLLQEEEQGL